VQDSSDGQSRENSIAGLADSLIGLCKDACNATRQVLRFSHRWRKDTQYNPRLGLGNPSAPIQALNYLLLCVNTQRNRSRVVQIPVSKSTNDNLLFSEIRHQYFRVRGWRSLFTLRAVDSIRFVKVYHLLYKSAKNLY